MNMKKTLLFLFAGIGIVAHADEAVNNTETEPSVEFIELRQAYQNRGGIAPEKNGFVYLTGIMAEKSKNPIEAGQSWITCTNEKRKPDECDADAGIIASLDDNYTDLMKSMNCKLGKEKVCDLAQYQSLAKVAIQNNAWLLERYHELLNLTAYENIQNIGVDKANF